MNPRQPLHLEGMPNHGSYKTAQRTSLIRPDTLQRFLAFGGLIVLIIVFSLASPYLPEAR